MKVLVVDDHAVVRQGLKQILAAEFKRAAFGEAGTTAEALARLGEKSWDVAILDVTMPGRSGIEVLEEARRVRPKMPVLILSMHPEDQFAVRMLKLGAAGYMNKESAPAELVGAVKKVLAGGRYVSAALAERMAAYLTTDVQQPPHERLSTREFQVLRLLASGRAVKEIAADLSLSIKTVSTYRTRLLEKMNMHSTAELVRYAVEQNLV
jgi:two-component system, NarL family, invasion response regulator UvrY